MAIVLALMAEGGDVHVSDALDLEKHDTARSPEGNDQLTREVSASLAAGDLVSQTARATLFQSIPHGVTTSLITTPTRSTPAHTRCQRLVAKRYR